MFVSYSTETVQVTPLEKSSVFSLIQMR